MLSARPAARRKWRPHGHDQQLPHRLRSTLVGHPRLEAVHLRQANEGTGCPDVRPGLQRPDRGSARARPARRHDGDHPVGVRAHAQGQPGRWTRSLAAMFYLLLRRRWRAGRTRGGQKRSHRRIPGRATGGTGRRRGDDLSQPRPQPRSHPPRAKRTPFPLVDFGNEPIKELFA